MRDILIDGAMITDPSDLHKQLAEKLDFPEYYGANLDALFDYLTDIREDVEICVESSDLLEETLGDYALRFFRVLRESAEENDHIHFED